MADPPPPGFKPFGTGSLTHQADLEQRAISRAAKHFAMSPDVPNALVREIKHPWYGRQVDAVYREYFPAGPQ